MYGPQGKSFASMNLYRVGSLQTLLESVMHAYGIYCYVAHLTGRSFASKQQMAGVDIVGSIQTNMKADQLRVLAFTLYIRCGTPVGLAGTLQASIE